MQSMGIRHHSMSCRPFSVEMLSRADVWFLQVSDCAAYLYDAVCVLVDLDNKRVQYSNVENFEFTGNTAVCVYSLS